MDQPNSLSQPSTLSPSSLSMSPTSSPYATAQPIQPHQPQVIAPQAARPQMISSNPLFKHFRQPALYINLTSNGAFWADGSLELTVTGEIPVYPMTAKDEIILRTPDALINGTSVVSVIQSCCPNIKDAWAMPSIDVDSTLIAIRIASYGKLMTVSAKCPHCGEENDYDANLEFVRDQITPPNYNEYITTNDGLTIKLKPLNYAQVSKAGTTSLEEDKMIQALSNPDIDDAVKTEEYNKHIQKMITLNIENATHCTLAIVVDGIEVTDPKFIKEYYQNAESSVLRKIQSKMTEFASSVGIKPLQTNCRDCEKEFSLNIEFDYARFFANGS